jgi:exopolysaccharide biosynthesis polyprenyl glycosylphosphotransferase
MDRGQGGDMRSSKTRVWHASQWTLFLLDYAGMLVAVYVGLSLSPRFSYEVLRGYGFAKELALIGYGMPLCMAAGLYLSGIQRLRAGFHLLEALLQAVIGIFSGVAAFVLLHVVIKYELVGRYILVIASCYGVGFVVASRYMIWTYAARTSRQVLIYGRHAVHDAISSQVCVHRLPIRPILASEPEELDLAESCSRNGISEVVLEVRGSISPRERTEMLRCMSEGIEVVSVGMFFEREFECVYVDGLNEAWFWEQDAAYRYPVYYVFKRCVDICIAIMGMLVSAPFVAVVGICIKFQDRGSIFYAQQRVGVRNTQFVIYKLRTMRLDAERNGPQWAKKGDARVTPLGRLLRLSRLDETPQFWNILCGDMSFIGPRPERPEFVEQLAASVPFYRYRHLIKPGLTGWAQVNAPYGASVEDAKVKLSYDLYYLKYASIGRDALILLRTIVAMVRGAR